MQQTIDIDGIGALFEEMLEGEKAQFLAGYTDSSGNVHPSGARRWGFTEKNYRKRFAELLYQSAGTCTCGPRCGKPGPPGGIHDPGCPDPAVGMQKDHSACIACKAGIRYDHNPIVAPKEIIP